MIDSFVHGRNRISGMMSDEAGRPLTRPGGTGKFYRRYFVAIPLVFLHVLRFCFTGLSLFAVRLYSSANKFKNEGGDGGPAIFESPEIRGRNKKCITQVDWRVTRRPVGKAENLICLLLCECVRAFEWLPFFATVYSRHEKVISLLFFPFAHIPVRRWHCLFSRLLFPCISS
jgi:hypothetical protein